MINASNAFKKNLYDGHRNYLEYVDITLKDGTELQLTNKDLWNGGITIEDKVSEKNVFEIGGAYDNSATFSLENIDDRFSDYDFDGADVIAYVGLNLPDGKVERVRKGTFTVNNPKYNASVITIPCLGNMQKFDKLYSESELSYPATLIQIVMDACEVCGVTLQTINFPHDDFMVQSRPADETITFRDIISWAAQISGCFARCDVYGRLELKWYDQELLEKKGYDGGIFDKEDPSKYVTGDALNGGSFNPWDDGDSADGSSFHDMEEIHHIYSHYSAPDVSTDDVVITGIRVIEKVEDENDASATVSYLSGAEGYVIEISGNDMIQGGNGRQISNWLGEQLIGFRFRRATLTHASDPTIEAGDVGIVTNRKNQSFPIIISSTRFSTGGSQTTESSAASPAKNSSRRFSAETKNYVEFRLEIQKERTNREKAQEELKKRIDNSSGLFTTEQTQEDGSKIYFMHDKPSLSESMIVWKMTAEAWGVSTNGGKSYNAGMTVDGNTIVKILSAIGVNADWINADTLSAITANLGTVTAGIIRSATYTYNSGNYSVSGIELALNNAGRIRAKNFAIDENGNAYYNGTLSASNIKGGTLAIGGVGNRYGEINVYGPDDVLYGEWTIDGLTIKDSSFVVIGSATISGVKHTTKNTFAGATSFEIDKELFFKHGPLGSNNIIGYGIATAGKYLSLGVMEGSTSAKNEYIINNGANPSGHTQRHIFYDDMRIFGNKLYMHNNINSNAYLSTAIYEDKNAFVVNDGGFYAYGSIGCSGTKHRVVETKNYGNIGMNSIEAAEPYFSDIGSGTIGENGEITIFFDPIFSETIDMDSEYQVFLTRTSQKVTEWVDKQYGYFIVHGEPGATFDWMVTCKQKDYSSMRMESINIEKFSEEDNKNIESEEANFG